MKRLLLGFLTGSLALIVCVLGYLHLGLANIAADAPTPAWQTRWMLSSVHASIRRTIPPDLKNPMLDSDDNLIAGGKFYLNDCVGCHGGPGKPASDFGATFYPPAPQLARDGTQYSEAQIYWVAKHGIRRTGMSAQGSDYSDEHLWLLARFISRIRSLPPRVQAGIEQGTAPMKTFFLGFVAAFVIFPAAALGYFRLGLASTPSDAEPPAWEGRIMQSTVRASIRRSAASMQVPSTWNFGDNIVEGGKLYFNGCMGCHGEPGKAGADHSHYPRAPQLPQVGTQYSPAEIHWIVKHGIRHTAMSAYGPFYSDKQLWALAAFVRKINYLSADELERIHPSKAPAGTTP